jgi:hypothetical protein
MSKEVYKPVKDIEIFDDEIRETISEEERYVAGIVPTTDDPSTPSLTFRVLFLGILWNVLFGCVNSVFHFRTNAFSLPSVSIISLMPSVTLYIACISNGYFHG